MIRTEQRVAITGLGMINCLGTCVRECWEGMVAGHTGIRRIARFDASGCQTQIGGELPDKYSEIEGQEFNKRMYKQTQMTTRLGFLWPRGHRRQRLPRRGP